MTDPEMIPLTHRERDMIVRGELARRRRIGDALRGRPKTAKHKRRSGEGLRRAWARRKAAKLAAQAPEAVPDMSAIEQLSLPLDAA